MICRCMWACRLRFRAAAARMQVLRIFMLVGVAKSRVGTEQVSGSWDSFCKQRTTQRSRHVSTHHVFALPMAVVGKPETACDNASLDVRCNNSEIVSIVSIRETDLSSPNTRTPPLWANLAVTRQPGQPMQQYRSFLFRFDHLE